MKVVHGFLLYRGLHELGQYAFLEILWEPAIKKEFLLYLVAFLVRICYCHQKVYYLTMQDTRCHDDLMSLTTSSLPMPISSALVAAGSWTTSSRRLRRRPTCEGCVFERGLWKRRGWTKRKEWNHMMCIAFLSMQSSYILIRLYTIISSLSVERHN
ncbi:uncharacterized protein LOC125532046 isoform X2 [Triticum urartu]|uniref:uncharacterized protein LOC125532046 isoform X2 n=1 Tax=Triticum urartu TaxID=4572 RepID=UPI0020443F80|nr:uncharacterized protein LOC125532046 isoform X2 [Triticum urartu]